MSSDNAHGSLTFHASSARGRRLRRTRELRALARETTLEIDKFIYPLFVATGSRVERAIESMPGQSQRSVDLTLREVERALHAGVRSVLLFGLPASKDAQGTQAWNPEGPVPHATREIKAAFPEVTVIADVCMCEYTDHGHCGVLHASSGDVLNDATLPLLARAAVAYADAGADIVAPSAMMDFQVSCIRSELDSSGHEGVAIMSYAAKFASAFYGPFRVAADSAPQFGDRCGYQMDPGNAREAVHETLTDVAEGADFVMVKPAGPYLDVIRHVRDKTHVPLAAYQVSGEYAMLKAAASRGWLDERRAVMESLTAIRRAGADLLITYFAPEVACWMREGR